jgi:hypothetical protein
MAPVPYPLINGLRYDFSSVEITAGARLFNGVKSIKFSQTLEPGKVRGNRSQVLGRTRGPLDSDGSLELYRLEFQDLISVLATLRPGVGFMEAAFDITVTYSEAGTPVIQDVLQGCRIKKHENSGQEGGDALTVACDLDIMMVLPGGVAPIGGRQLLR